MLPFPIYSVPTWMIINADSSFDLPLMGQFDPDPTVDGGKPIWVKKPGIAGGNPWMKYVGKGHETLTFLYHAIAANVADLYPSASWEKLNELASVDSVLGRPPRVFFIHGLTIVEGYITNIPKARMDHWENTRIVREMGPVQVEITIIPNSFELPVSTNFVQWTEHLSFEDICRRQYGDARYAHSVMLYNQGTKKFPAEEPADDAEEEDFTLELPRRYNPEITKLVDIAPFYDTTDAIEGL